MSSAINRQLTKTFLRAPTSVLGLFADSESKRLRISTFQPDADHVEIIAEDTNKSLGRLHRINNEGLFSLLLRRKVPFRYRFRIALGDTIKEIDDPYQFSPVISEMDLHLLNEGNHFHPHKILGAHPIEHQGVLGSTFTVWAPNASHVAVVGDFNHWNDQVHPLVQLRLGEQTTGYRHLFVPLAQVGDHYKFAIKDSNGQPLPLKADPYARQSELRPNTASIIAPESHFEWRDKTWIDKRQFKNASNAAISIYEVHLGSWRRDANNQFLNYREIAKELLPYVIEMGFTHIQLLPISEHPFDGSWGYQPLGLFAPTSRFGNAQDFQFFVDLCHQHNIGVLIDWVPGHFPNDAHGIANFDGSFLFDHADPRQGFHPDWNTHIYNYGRTEVSNFLRASATHWLEDFHIDGVRVDAVASMLYLDYSRAEGDWIPNRHGGRENLEAIDFLQRFNNEVSQRFTGCFTVAEESTAWPGVSKPVEQQGLGFSFKWNMGWMNDTLSYMQRDPLHRKHHHNDISFGLVYAFDENFILPLSHDEVVHGKRSILGRMPGDCWQQFANVRAYYGFMWAHPGKKLMFMGCEFAQGREWNHDKALDWHQLEIHWHSGVQRLVKDLNHVYQRVPALHQLDCEPDGFQWLDHKNAKQSVYSFIRYDQHRNAVIVVCNFTPQTHENFRLGVPKAGKYREIINTDRTLYAGSGVVNNLPLVSNQGHWQGQEHSIEIVVPPLSTLMLIESEN